MEEKGMKRNLMTFDSIDDIPVSTKTIIASSNIQLDIFNIFQTMPVALCSPEGVQLKVLYYQNQIRGDESLIKKKGKKSFRNAINVILQVDEYKHINFKLSKNGKFQLTGCKHEHHAIESVKFFIHQLLLYCSPYVLLEDRQQIRVYFQTVMTNIDFSVGFCIDRQKLDDLLNQQTPFHSLLETSFGYTGVNVKFSLQQPWLSLPVPLLSLNLEAPVPGASKWTLTQRPLDSLIPKECHTVLQRKKKYNTFLVFHSGNVIMSGMTKQTMKEDFTRFYQLIQEWKPLIEEQIH